MKIFNRLKPINLVSGILKAAEELQGWDAEKLRCSSLALKYELMSSDSRIDVMRRGFPLVMEAVRQKLGFSFYPCQLQCGLELSAGKIAEMKTGEGKTLTAALPVFLEALAGRGTHVVTVNDYLARRDCEFLQSVFGLLGLSSSYLVTDEPTDVRAAKYRTDITYGAAKEFGFDFLRDRLKRLHSPQAGANHGMTMRQLNFALIDEADSILIDEARTPLIIGMVDQEDEKFKAQCFRWAAEHAPKFSEHEHFTYDFKKKRVQLTVAGRSFLRRLPQNESTSVLPIHELYSYLENAIKVRRDFEVDKHYAIVDGKVVIIDEFTGRPAEGRQWQNGIHQSVEAKEGLEFTPATRQAAAIHNSIDVQALPKNQRDDRNRLDLKTRVCQSSGKTRCPHSNPSPRQKGTDGTKNLPILAAKNPRHR